MKHFHFSLFVLLFSIGALAETQSLLVGDKKVEFEKNDKLKLIISKSCLKAKSKFSCEAFLATQKASFNFIKKDLKGGKNPGAQICRLQLKGSIVYGVDENHNENTFCVFKDNSMISNGSLHYYGVENDRLSGSKKLKK